MNTTSKRMRLSSPVVFLSHFFQSWMDPGFDPNWFHLGDVTGAAPQDQGQSVGASLEELKDGQAQLNTRSLMQGMLLGVIEQKVSTLLEWRGPLAEKREAETQTDPMEDSSNSSIPMEIHMNEGWVDFDKEVTAREYLREIGEKMEQVTCARGKLFSTKHPHSASIFSKAIIFLNRPYCFVTERWPSMRPPFTCSDDVQCFISMNKRLIVDFFSFCVRGVVAGKNPSCRSTVEIKLPYQNKNVVKSWQGQMTF